MLLRLRYYHKNHASFGMHIKPFLGEALTRRISLQLFPTLPLTQPTGLERQEACQDGSEGTNRLFQ